MNFFFLRELDDKITANIPAEVRRLIKHDHKCVWGEKNKLIYTEHISVCVSDSAG